MYPRDIFLLCMDVNGGKSSLIAFLIVLNFCLNFAASQSLTYFYR